MKTRVLAIGLILLTWFNSILSNDLPLTNGQIYDKVKAKVIDSSKIENVKTIDVTMEFSNKNLINNQIKLEKATVNLKAVIAKEEIILMDVIITSKDKLSREIMTQVVKELVDTLLKNNKEKREFKVIDNEKEKLYHFEFEFTGLFTDVVFMYHFVNYDSTTSLLRMVMIFDKKLDGETTKLLDTLRYQIQN